MRWFKLLNAEGEIIGAEAHEEPAFVYRQRNCVIVNCEERKAMGLCAADGSVLYDLDGRESLGADAAALAVEIDWQSYNDIVHELPDPEDEEPETPDGGAPVHIPTRLELTQRVETLEAENRELHEALYMLLSGVTEDEA